MGRTATVLEKQKILKKRNQIKRQKQSKEALRNERRENEQMKRELYIAEARTHTVAPKYIQHLLPNICTLKALSSFRSYYHSVAFCRLMLLKRPTKPSARELSEKYGKGGVNP